MTEYFKSLDNQIFKDFEVIIVDDCSTDGSYEQLQKYIDTSPLDIHLYQSKKNLGPGNARNIGLDKACGEWITFVDNDDWVADNFLSLINDIIIENDVNAVIYDYYGVLDGKLSVNHSMYIPSPGYKTADECVVSVRNHTFGKFYKFTECASLRFPLIRRCEDVAFVAQALCFCGNAYYIMEPLYYYRQRPSSLSNKNSLDESEMIEAFSILEKELGENFKSELGEKSVTDLLYGVLLMMCKANKPSKYIREYINSYELKYPDWHKSRIIEYLGKPKQLFLKCAKMRFIIALKAIASIHSYIISKGS